jgi:predicted XRE-type DNA-binding protein
VAAEILEVEQPRVSALRRRRLAGFSFDRPVRFLVLLGKHVKIFVRPRASGAGQARVIVA